MTLTEDEAKTKWCPYAMAQSTMGKHGFNRRARVIPKSCMCIASACMAWRWEVERATKIVDAVETEYHFTSPTHGHCGLAAQP